MLDSLVRVSRRVGGAADLLATEMQAVPVRDTRYTSLLSYPPRPEPGKTQGSTGANQSNFTHALGPATVVRCVNLRRNAAAARAHQASQSLQI
jgi:hypothetical protein